MEKLEMFLERLKQFNKARNWEQFHTPCNLAKSISIEASELLEHFQWTNNAYNKEEVQEELADVMTYCLQMALTLNVDIIDIMNQKMNKTELKYPVEKSKGNAIKYNKL